MVIDCLASVLNRESWALRHSPSWTYKMEDELRQHYDLYQTVRDAIATSSTTATLGMVNIRDTNHFYFNVLKYYRFVLC